MKITFYEVDEIFTDVDEETLDLFIRKDFSLEDIAKLKNLKMILTELEDEIELKIQNILTRYLHNF